MKIVLGIETSCDDTSVCLLEDGTPPRIISLQHFSQEQIFNRWGGVIPEVAARNHTARLTPLLTAVFEEAKMSLQDIAFIGVTTSPGLLGPLLTGLSTAKTLSWISGCPIVPVNHLYAHLEAIHLTESVSYPYLGLVVSGGHTLFLLCKSSVEFKLLGTTLDDAAGEAFDKGGKLLGLAHPGGKEIDRLALQGKVDKKLFPVGLKKRMDADMSYSGVKTALRNLLAKRPLESLSENERRDICASYQHAIVEEIVIKVPFAFQKSNTMVDSSSLPLVVGGGVACNSYLRRVLKEKYPQTHFVKPCFCTDNGAMIANYALRTFKKRGVDYPKSLELEATDRFIFRRQILERVRRQARNNK